MALDIFAPIFGIGSASNPQPREEKIPTNLANADIHIDLQLGDDVETFLVAASDESRRGNDTGQSHSSGSKHREDSGETHYG